MALSKIGMLTPAAMKTIMDRAGAIVRHSEARMGKGLESESSAKTVAYYGRRVISEIFGDGPGGSYTGIDNAELQTRLQRVADNFRRSTRYEVFCGGLLREYFGAVESFLRESLPSGWNWTDAGVNPIDAHLRRLNGTHPLAPTKPTNTPTITATVGGSLPAMAADQVQFAFAWVGEKDFYESLPIAAVNCPALSDLQNAFQVALSGTVPTGQGVTKLRAYRTKVGGSSLYFVRDIDVTPGAAIANFLLTEPDIYLRTDIGPASWLSAMSGPEAAAAYALAYATLSTRGGEKEGQISLQSIGMLDPSVVTVNPGNLYLGIENPPSTALFGRYVQGSGYTENTILAANDSAKALQGFRGAIGAKLRVTAPLNANASVSNVTYKYYDASSPKTLLDGTALAVAGTLNADLGSELDLAIATDRLVARITGASVTGISSGTFVVEGKVLRDLD